jgi:hypothetical protein
VSKADTLARANRDAYFRTTRAPKEPLAPGDRIGWTKYFLRCTGATSTDERWSARGTIVAFSPDFVRVSWDDGYETLVAPRNICRIAPTMAFGGD